MSDRQSVDLDGLGNGKALGGVGEGKPESPLSFKEREKGAKFYTSLLNEKGSKKIKHPTRRKIE